MQVGKCRCSLANDRVACCSIPAMLPLSYSCIHLCIGVLHCHPGRVEDHKAMRTLRRRCAAEPLACMQGEPCALGRAGRAGRAAQDRTGPHRTAQDAMTSSDLVARMARSAGAHSLSLRGPARPCRPAWYPAGLPACLARTAPLTGAPQHIRRLAEAGRCGPGLAGSGRCWPRLETALNETRR